VLLHLAEDAADRVAPARLVASVRALGRAG
jgi:hypothetical protein